MSFQKITATTLIESRFGDVFDLNEIELFGNFPTDPVKFPYKDAASGQTYDVIISPKRTGGFYIELYKIEQPFADILPAEQKATIQLIKDIDYQDNYIIIGNFRTHGYCDIYTATFGTDSQDTAFTFQSSTKKNYLEQFKINKTPPLPDENSKTVTVIPFDILQYSYDAFPTMLLPGEKTAGETLAGIYQAKSLPEFLALIIIDEKKKVHTFIYWTGDPKDAEATVVANKIIYYQITLPDQMLKDGKLLSVEYPSIYKILQDQTSAPDIPTLDKNKAVDKGKSTDVGTNTDVKDKMDPMSLADIRTLMFNLNPVNPPEDKKEHTVSELRAGLDIDPSTLVGWFITQPQDSDIGYFETQAQKQTANAPAVEPGGNVITKDFTFKDMGGHVRSDKLAYMFVQKIHPPDEILTVFDRGKSDIPTGFLPDNSDYATKVNFTAANFRSQAEFIIVYLRSYPDLARIKIYGYTDTYGGKTTAGKQSNLNLSQLRADAFRDYLKNATDLTVPPLNDLADKSIIGSVGLGQDAAEKALDKTHPLGTEDPRFRKITIDYDVK